MTKKFDPSHADDEGIPRLSKSALQTFSQCPEKFKFSYIDRISDPGGKEAILGKHIHEVLFEYHRMLNLDNVKSEADLVEHAKQFDKPLITEHLKNFTNFTCQMYRSLKNKEYVKPIMAEEKLIHPELNMSGLVDAVYKDDNDNCLILDYKSGKYDDRRIPDYRMELSVYAELVNQRSSYVPTHWGIFFTGVGVLWTEPVDKNYFKEVVRPLFASVQHHVRKKDFPPKTGPLCLYCSYKRYCSAWGGPTSESVPK